jgi:phosphatidate cytidylyltransferase
MDFPPGGRGRGRDDDFDVDFDPLPKREPRPPRRSPFRFPEEEPSQQAPPAARPSRPPPGEPPSGSRRPSGETLARIGWALPWIVFAITIVALGGLVFAGAMIVFAWIGLAELFQMTRVQRPLVPVALAAAAGMVIAAYYGDHFQIVLAGVAAFPLLLVGAALREDREGISGSLAVTVFGIAWIGIPFAHAVLLRELPDHGDALLVDVLVATFVGDTAAYGIGRWFGRRPLAPSLSPNKTVEGLVGGIIGGTMGFWFAGLYQDWLPGVDALLMGLCVALLAPAGDLFESLIKRDLDIKDSGNVFGPHGGILDRLDAVLFTIVAGYYLSVAFVY